MDAWTPETPPVTTESTRPAPRPSARTSWERRDRRLVVATAVTGIMLGASAIAGTALGIEIRKSVDRCSRATYTECDETRDRVQQLLPPSYAMVAIIGASLVGVLVSGIMLGVHRSRRPELARTSGPRVAWSSSGLRLSF